MRRRPCGVHVGYHLGCGGEVYLYTIPSFRTGNWERFAEPDGEYYQCQECGEQDFYADEIVDTYEEAMRDEFDDDYGWDDEDEEEDDTCSTA